MENNETFTVTDSIHEFVPKAAYDEVVNDLANSRIDCNTARNSESIARRNLESLRDEVKTFVVDSLGGHASDSDLRNFAEACGIELTRSVQFTVTATFLVSADVDISVDVDDDIKYALSASLTFDGLDGVDNFDTDEGDIDVTDIQEV